MANKKGMNVNENQGKLFAGGICCFASTFNKTGNTKKKKESYTGHPLEQWKYNTKSSDRPILKKRRGGQC